MYRSRPGKPNPFIAEVSGSITDMINLLNELTVIFYGQGVLGSAAELSVAYYPNQCN